MFLTFLGFFFDAQFICGLVAGSVITLIVNNNISKKAKAAVQAELDAANAKIASVVSKVK